MYFRFFSSLAWLSMLTIFLTACDQAPEANKKLTSDVPELVAHAEAGDLSKINELLSLGKNPDIKDSCQWTPLMKAAQYGHIDIVKVLLKSGAQIDQTDKGGYTALLLAASRNHADIVDLLIQQGANINHQEQTMGWSALIWASKLNYTATVKTLVQHGANLHIKDFKNNTALMWAKEIQSKELVSLLEAADQRK